MTNPTSLASRNLTPLCSHPATIPGWEIHFDSTMGFADIRPHQLTMEEKEAEENSGEVEKKKKRVAPVGHGVLHLMSDAQMLVLDSIEVTYDRIKVLAHLYEEGRAPIEAVAYKIKEPPKKISLPSERYIDIISQGCLHHGVCSKYVQYLKEHPCQPRVPPHARKTIDHSTVPTDKTWTLEQLAECIVNYDPSGRAVLFSLTGVVFGLKDEAANHDPIHTNVLKLINGKDITHFFSKVIFEPLYGVPSSYEDMHPDHKSFVVDFTMSLDWFPHFKPMGIVPTLYAPVPVNDKSEPQPRI